MDDPVRLGRHTPGDTFRFAAQGESRTYVDKWALETANRYRGDRCTMDDPAGRGPASLSQDPAIWAKEMEEQYERILATPLAAASAVVLQSEYAAAKTLREVVSLVRLVVSLWKNAMKMLGFGKNEDNDEKNNENQQNQNKDGESRKDRGGDGGHLGGGPTVYDRYAGPDKGGLDKGDGSMVA